MPSSGPSPERVVREILKEYQQRLQENNIAGAPPDLRKSYADLSKNQILAFARYCCDEALGAKKKERLVGSLDFIQILLSFAGWYTLEELQQTNRRIWPSTRDQEG